MSREIFTENYKRSQSQANLCNLKCSIRFVWGPYHIEGYHTDRSGTPLVSASTNWNQCNNTSTKESQNYWQAPEGILPPASAEIAQYSNWHAPVFTFWWFYKQAILSKHRTKPKINVKKNTCWQIVDRSRTNKSTRVRLPEVDQVSFPARPSYNHHHP